MNRLGNPRSGTLGWLGKGTHDRLSDDDDDDDDDDVKITDNSSIVKVNPRQEKQIQNNYKTLFRSAAANGNIWPFYGGGVSH